MAEEKNIFERNNITDANLAFEYAKKRAAEGNYTPEIAQEKINKFMDYYYDYEDSIADENDMLNSMSDNQRRNKFAFDEIDSYNYNFTETYTRQAIRNITAANNSSAINSKSPIVSDIDVNNAEYCGAKISLNKEDFFNISDDNNEQYYSNNRTISVGDKILYPRIKDALLNMYNNEGIQCERFGEDNHIIISKDGKNWTTGITFNDDTNSFTIPNDNEQYLRFAKLYGDAYKSTGYLPRIFIDTANSHKTDKTQFGTKFREQYPHEILMNTYNMYNMAKELQSVDFKEVRPDFSVNVTTFSNSDLASYSWGIDFQHGMLKNEYFNTLKKDHDARIKGSIMAQNPTDIPNGALYALCDGTITKLSQEDATEIFTKIKANLSEGNDVNIGFASPAGHNSGVCLSYAGLKKDSKVFKGYEEVQIFAEGMFNNDPYVQAYDKDPSTRARKKLELWAGQHNINIAHSIRFGNKNTFELHCTTNTENGKPMYAMNVNGKLKPISQDDALSIYTASLSLQDNIRQYQMYKNNMGNDEKEATMEIYKQWRDNNLRSLLENKIYGRKLTDEEFSSITSTIYDEYFGDYFHK